MYHGSGKRRIFSRAPKEPNPTSMIQSRFGGGPERLALLCAWLGLTAILSDQLHPVGRFTQTQAAAWPEPAWGRISPATNSTGTIQLEVRSWPADGKLSLPAPFPNMTAAHLLT